MAISKRIVYNAHEGGVHVVCPSKETFAFMQGPGDPQWRFQRRSWIDEQIDRQIANGIKSDYAARLARALQGGGQTERDCWEIIRDRDCLHYGNAPELVDYSDLPSKRYRHAWRRSHNGGPVYVDVKVAKHLHFVGLTATIDQANKQKRYCLERAKMIAEPSDSIRDAILKATDVDELQRIWPEGVPPALWVLPSEGVEMLQ